MPSETRKITVRFDVDGLHAWDGCPLKEVAFLNQPHRHLFKVRVTVTLRPNADDDRALEFFVLRDRARYALNRSYEPVSTLYGWLDFGNSSCEMIARRLVDELMEFEAIYDVASAIEVVVSEDGENEASYERTVV